MGDTTSRFSAPQYQEKKERRVKKRNVSPESGKEKDEVKNNFVLDSNVMMLGGVLERLGVRPNDVTEESATISPLKKKASVSQSNASSPYSKKLRLRDSIPFKTNKVRPQPVPLEITGESYADESPDMVPQSESIDFSETSPVPKVILDEDLTKS